MRIIDIIKLLQLYYKLPYTISPDIVNYINKKIFTLHSIWHKKEIFFIANLLSYIDRLLGHDVCLKRALFLYNIFAITDNNVELCIGVNLKQTNEGHAWVLVNDVSDLTLQTEKQYKIIAKFAYRLPALNRETT